MCTEVGIQMRWDGALHQEVVDEANGMEIGQEAERARARPAKLLTKALHLLHVVLQAPTEMAMGEWHRLGHGRGSGREEDEAEGIGVRMGD